jgi:hypothetical protein
MAKWPNILGRAEDDNVAHFPALERDAQPTRPHRPDPNYMGPFGDHPMPPPVPKKRKSLLPDDVENELIISQEMIEVLYPLDQQARDRIMKMITDTLALYPKAKPEPKPEHPEGAPV